MSEIAWPMLFLLGALGVSLAWVVLVYRAYSGCFRVETDTPEQFHFSSDEGRFALNRTHGTLAWKQAGQWRSIKLENIGALDYRVQEEEALGAELLFGLDLTDLYRRYHDTVEVHSIAAVSGYERIPLFRSGRLRRREFLLGWFIDAQEGLLIRIGLLENVERQAQQALALLQAKFGKPRA